MLGRELLVPLRRAPALRGLDEAPRPLGVFFDIHASHPFRPVRDPKPRQHRPRHPDLELAPKGGLHEIWLRSFTTIAPRKAHLFFEAAFRHRYSPELTVAFRSDPCSLDAARRSWSLSNYIVTSRPVGSGSRSASPTVAAVGSTNTAVGGKNAAEKREFRREQPQVGVAVAATALAGALSAGAGSQDRRDGLYDRRHGRRRGSQGARSVHRADRRDG